MTIPRTIHQIWLGPTAPSSVQQWMQSWPRHHPAWDYRLWGDSDLSWLRFRREFELAEQYAIKADIARLEILYRFGGVYADADIEAHRPIDQLVGESKLVLLSEGDLITNAFIAAEPGDRTVQAALERIARIPRARIAKSDWSLPATGPLLITHAAVDTQTLFTTSTRLLAPDVACLPRSRIPEVARLAEDRRWMTHHASASWRSGRTLTARLRRTRLRTRVRRFFDLGAS